MRMYLRGVARLAEWFGDKRRAEGYRCITNDKARDVTRDTFGRLRAGEAANPNAMRDDDAAFRRGEYSEMRICALLLHRRPDCWTRQYGWPSRRPARWPSGTELSGCWRRPLARR